MKKRNQKPRLTRKVYDDPEVIKAVKRVKRSKGHVAVTKTGGKLFELIVRDLNLYKVPLSSEITEDGYRKEGSMTIGSGRHVIKEWVKHIMGKTPRQLGIKLQNKKEVKDAKDDETNQGKD
jgi:hypothetical protein